MARTWSNEYVVEDLERRLAAAAGALRKYELTTMHATDLHRRMAELTAQLDSLRAQHAAEYEDVQRLEGLSLTRVFASLQGSREDRLSQERADVYAAHYRVWVAETCLDAVRREYEAVRVRLAQLVDAPAIYAAMLDERERELQESDDPRRARLLGLAVERGRLTGELHEMGEALRAAGIAQESLEQVRHRLGDASKWSIPVDLFGEPISAAVADSRLEQVAAAAAYADRCLAGLRIELADVAGVVPRERWLAIGQTTRFFELWLDSTFARLAVREQVARAQQRVDRSAQVVNEVRSWLEVRTAEARAGLDQIETERRILLAGQ